MVSKATLLLPCASAALFFATGLYVLFEGHPHEDAFILFKYARMWAAGHGIAFYPGGPPTEGATDFAWLAALTCLSRLGVDVAFGALVLNALGAGLASWVLLRGIDWSRRTVGEKRVFAAMILAIVVNPAAHAAYVGFSSISYGAVALLLLHLLWSERRSSLVWIPVVGLVLALMRPDGLILGGGFGVAGLVLALRRGSWQAYALSALFAVSLGALYLLWRYHTFGLALPLALYVKSNTQSPWPGLDPNLEWLIHRAPRLLVILAVFLLLKKPLVRQRSLPVLLGLAPFGLHWIGLCFGMQTQNVGARFQAPLVLALQYLLLVLFARPSKLGPRGLLLLLVFCGGALAARDGRSLYRYTLRPTLQGSYIDSFARRAGGCLGSEALVALTEAGRMGFWTEARIVDLVGLNTPELARRPPSIARLMEFDPDLIMLHHAGTLRTDGLPAGDVVALEGGWGERIVDVGYADEWIRANPPPYRRLELNNVPVAAVVGLRFLEQNADRYALFAVRYDGALAHVYGFKREFSGFACLVQALREAPPEERGYARLRWSF